MLETTSNEASSKLEDKYITNIKIESILLNQVAEHILEILALKMKHHGHPVMNTQHVD